MMPKKNGRQPRRKKKEKMEDELKYFFLNERHLKLEDEPINQNQPNWL